MNASATDDNNNLDNELIFSCRIESNKIFSDLLNSLVEKERKDQLCFFEITRESKHISIQYVAL